MGTLARLLAVGRIAFGAALLLKPETAVGGWVGKRAARHEGTQVVTQACGARDLALGAGALAAFLSGREARDWVVAGAACDLVDLTATLTAEDIPAAGRVLVGALATGAIAVGAGYLVAGEGE